MLTDVMGCRLSAAPLQARGRRRHSGRRQTSAGEASVGLPGVRRVTLLHFSQEAEVLAAGVSV